MECYDKENICGLPDRDIMKANLLEVWKLQALNIFWTLRVIKLWKNFCEGDDRYAIAWILSDKTLHLDTL